MNRIKEIQERVSRRRLKAFLVSSLNNIRYLTGFTGSSALLLVTGSGAFFFTDFRYKEQSLGEVTGCEIIVVRGPYTRALQRTLKALGISRLGFEESAPYSLYRSLARGFVLRPVRDMVESMRMEKDRRELALIRRAVERAEEAFRRIKGRIRRGATERSIALRLEEELRRTGCRRAPFDIIVASGENAAFPHATASDRRLRAGDTVVIDWGGEAEGYCSDMTRSFLIRGAGLERKIRIYNAVLKANRSAINAVREGRRAREVDRAARDVIERAGLGECFGHGTGHGVGLDIHEAPRISWMSKERLRQGMVFTIEPGVYIPGLGGVRIEDMVYTGRKGPRVLTSLPKGLEII